MTNVSNPLISEIVSAPARSRPQAPVRDEDKFVIPEDHAVEKPRNEDNDLRNDVVQPVAPVHHAVADPAQATGADQSTEPAQSNPGVAGEETVSPDAAVQSAGLVRDMQNDVPAGANRPSPDLENAATTSPVIPQTAPTIVGTETSIADKPSPANTGATAESATRANAASLVGVNPGQTQPAQSPALENQTPVNDRITAAQTMSSPAAAQNNVAVQQAAVVQTGTRPVDRATSNGIANPSTETSAEGSTHARSSAAGNSSVLPATLAVDADNTVTNPVTATGGSGTNTQPQTQTNNQILAQALASSAAEPAPSGSTPTPTQISPTVTGDTMSVTQSFNAEMRAAIDAPTQAAAYTARGAVTPQPATEQIAMQISRAADQGVDRLSVQLKPAELGKVTIDLEIGPDNRLLAVISAERSETLDLLQRDARSLEKALAEAGVETDSGSLEFSLQGDGDSAENDSDGDKKLIDGAVMLPGDAIDADAGGTLTNTPLILPEGRLDIQV